MNVIREMREQDKTFITRRTFLIASIGTCLCAVSPLDAYATTWGLFKSETFQGVKYEFRAGVDGGLSPKAYSYIKASPKVGANKLATQAQLYNRERILIASSKLTYGNGSTANASVAAQASRPGYMGAGISYTYSPEKHQFKNNMTPQTYSFEPPTFLNEEGQTLGSLLDADPLSPPTLICSLTDEGVPGYIYYKEAFGGNESPDRVNVYAENGKTILGTFSFGNK